MSERSIGRSKESPDDSNTLHLQSQELTNPKSHDAITSMTAGTPLPEEFGTFKLTDKPDPKSDQATNEPLLRGNFTTKDGQIYDPQGKPFIARGFAMYSWDATSENIEKATEELKPNIVRLATSPDRQTPEQVQKVIDAFTQKGIVVEVEDHVDSATRTGAGLQKIASWYAQIAAHNVHNPYLWFGTPNEQHVVNGDRKGWVNEQKTIYNSIRQTGNENIIMLEQEFGGKGQGLRDKAQTDLATYRAMKNVAIDQHFYSGKPDADQLLDRVLAKTREIGLPVIVGEFGNTNGPRDLDDARSVAAVIKANEEQKIGAIAWAWENPGGRVGPNGDGNAMFDRNGNITRYGKQIEEWVNQGSQANSGAGREHGRSPVPDSSDSHDRANSGTSRAHTPKGGAHDLVEHQGTHAYRPRTTAARLDANGDGELSINELCRSLLAADRDGNGIFSSRELTALFAALKEFS